MSKYSLLNNMRLNKKGFTLIELLIVIALLGALAVGLLAALDPFEQLKKGVDTGTRNTVSEVQGAIIRYYAIKGFMPWCTAADTCPSEPNHTALNASPMDTAITAIIATGELKSNFVTLAANDLAKIFVTGSQATGTVSVCYAPTAKSFIADPNTKYDNTGTVAGTPNTLGEYWCVQ